MSQKFPHQKKSRDDAARLEQQIISEILGRTGSFIERSLPIIERQLAPHYGTLGIVRRESFGPYVELRSSPFKEYVQDHVISNEGIFHSHQREPTAHSPCESTIEFNYGDGEGGERYNWRHQKWFVSISDHGHDNNSSSIALVEDKKSGLVQLGISLRGCPTQKVIDIDYWESIEAKMRSLRLQGDAEFIAAIGRDYQASRCWRVQESDETHLIGAQIVAKYFASDLLSFSPSEGQ